MLLSPIELDYEAIYSSCASYTLSSINWVDQSSDYGTPSDPFCRIFAIDESIMEIMEPNDALWDDHHHHSSFPYSIEDNLSDLYLPNVVKSFTNSIFIHEFESKKNPLNIDEAIPLDIYVKLGIVKNLHIGPYLSPPEIETYKTLFQDFHDVFSWTYEEILGIDPNIVVHEIKTYPNAKPVWQHLHLVHPKKATIIKNEVEKNPLCGFHLPHSSD